MVRKGIPDDVISLMRKLLASDTDWLTDSSIQGNLSQNGPTLHIFTEFYQELGYFRLIGLLLLILCISFYIAYTVSGLYDIHKTRVPIEIDPEAEMMKEEL